MAEIRNLLLRNTTVLTGNISPSEQQIIHSAASMENTKRLWRLVLIIKTFPLFCLMCFKPERDYAFWDFKSIQFILHLKIWTSGTLWLKRWSIYKYPLILRTEVLCDLFNFRDFLTTDSLHVPPRVTHVLIFTLSNWPVFMFQPTLTCGVFLLQPPQRKGPPQFVWVRQQRNEGRGGHREVSARWQRKGGCEGTWTMLFEFLNRE